MPLSLTGQSGYKCCPTVLGARALSRAASRRLTIKRAVNEAVLRRDLSAGGIATFEQAEGILERVEADIVGAARQSLRRPPLYLKVRPTRA